MDRRTKLKTLCETRWTARADTLFTFKASSGTVVHTLEDLAKHIDAKAGAYKAAVTQFTGGCRACLVCVYVAHKTTSDYFMRSSGSCNGSLGR
ncbi:hypothetical protein DPMN_127660 [Dreissena polymorpha]|uniref:Uncharacterized protein n=1 Tax=Dreissena polymorpha TaxID=45954 RepID=A0A9D4H1L4_DREPO|nr:hypothetical protein DPMN_127660 [Dreissena polymorpha]